MIQMVAIHVASSMIGLSPRAPDREVGEVLPWAIALIVFILVGGVIIFLVRRWMRQDSTVGGGSAGFTLQDLRELHARGELTNEQYEAAKSAMVQKLARPAVSKGDGATMKR